MTIDTIPFWLDVSGIFAMALLVGCGLAVLFGLAVIVEQFGSARATLLGQHQREMQFRMRGADVLRG